MAEELNVEATLERGVIVLTVNYGQQIFLMRESYDRFSKALTGGYQQIRGKVNAMGKAIPCIVIIQTRVAGSALVRGLFDLWREVGAGGGQMICVDYPEKYLDSLTSLGLPSMRGFSLAGNKDEAFRRLKV